MSATEAPQERMRLQRFLADAGVASRRHAEQVILEGRVLVNNRVVEMLPAFIDPQRDTIVVDGVRVHVQQPEYFLVHKPKGVVCTNRDPEGRRRAIDLLPPLPARLFPVGRLDTESSGLLLMTNDGELAQRITHPRFEVPKLYRVEVKGAITPDVCERLKKGVYFEEGRAHVAGVEVVHQSRQNSVLLVTLNDSRNREIRRMLLALGHPVKKLQRIQIGPLSIKGLPVGASRRLSDWELRALRALVSGAGIVVRGPRPRRTRAAIQKPRRSTARGRAAVTPKRERPKSGRRVVS